MTRIDLRSPVPRTVSIQRRRHVYKIRNKQYLDIPTSVKEVGFFATIESRQTRREFGKVSDEALSTLLWYCCKTRRLRSLADGQLVEHRCCPSAGGIHPIDTLLVDREKTRLFLYDGLAHALCNLEGIREPDLRGLTDEISSIVQLDNCQIVWFVAQFDRTLSLYENGESLLWRDAGVVVATFCYVAEALGLNCCPIGIHGEPFISRLLQTSGDIVGVGGCLIGSRA